MYCLNFISRDLELEHIVSSLLTFLDQSMSCNNNEKLPLGMMPMLPFRYSRLGNIDTNLTTLCSM